MLENANVRLNIWRKRRFSEFLTDLGNGPCARVYRQISLYSRTSFVRRLRVSMTTKQRPPSCLANRKRGSSHFPTPSPFGTLPLLYGDSRAAQTGRANGLPGPGGQVLNTAKRIVEPDGHPTPTSQLATSAADYPPRPHSLWDSQTTNRLGTVLTNWKLLTSDKWTLQAVTGYKIPFLGTPRQWRPRPMVTKAEQQNELMRETTQCLISKGAITVVAPHPQYFISTLFLLEKGQGTGEFRPVINLRALNRFLTKEKFTMEGLHTVRSLLRSGDYMMKLDLKDAYYAVPIHQDSRKYLRFQFEGTTFEFRWLPFGLSLAPRVFTRILCPVVAKLRSEGVRTVIYLDDLLLIHHQKETLIEIFHYVQKLLPSLDFVVKREKCSPAPTRKLIFLSPVLDTNQMTLAVQIDRIQTVCQQILETGTTTLGELASLLGRMNHAARTGLWEAPLHYRVLQRLSTPPGRMEAEDAHISESTISGGPCMMAVSNPSLSQQAGHHSTPLRPYSQDGCILTRLGCNLQGQHNRGR